MANKEPKKIDIASKKSESTKAIRHFIRNNQIISSAFIIAWAIISLYGVYSTLQNFSTWYVTIFTVVFQLAIGFVINFLFYVTQVYVPTQKKNYNVYKCVKREASKITQSMIAPIIQMAWLYLPDHHGTDYSDDDLKVMANIHLNDKVNVINANTNTNMTLREYILSSIYEVELYIDRLFRFYSSYVSESLMLAIEEVLHSEYHVMMKSLAAYPRPVNFGSASSYLLKYYHLRVQIDQILSHDYQLPTNN